MAHLMAYRFRIVKTVRPGTAEIIKWKAHHATWNRPTHGPTPLYCKSCMFDTGKKKEERRQQKEARSKKKAQKKKDDRRGKRKKREGSGALLYIVGARIIKMSLQ